MAQRERVWRVVEEVLERIRPSDSEIGEALRVYRIIRDRLSRGFPHDVFHIDLYGSIAKGTALSGDLDLDVFVLIPREYGKRWIRENFVRIAREALGDIKAEERYAEHPYLRARIGGFEIDIVPALRISIASEAITAADRTPFHTEYVRRMLKGDLGDHVRLLKKFMKGVGVYGAEIRVGGFSGYVAELLVISLGGFVEVLESASRWRPPVVIIPPGAEDKISISEALRIFRGSPLVIPDPVDVRRNAGAAVTLRKLSEFIVASRLFLEKPTKYFFEPVEIDESMIERAIEIHSYRGTCTVFIEISLARNAPDNIWGELKSLSRRIYNILESENYPVLRRDEYWDEESGEALIAIEMLACSTREPLEIKGPPAWVNNSVDFIEKQLGMGYGFWIDDSGRLMGVRRRERSAIEAIEAIIKAGTPKDIKTMMRISVNPREVIDRWIDKPGFKEWIYTFLSSVPRYMAHV